jgi:nucleoid DNA-binding protein
MKLEMRDTIREYAKFADISVAEARRRLESFTSFIAFELIKGNDINICRDMRFSTRVVPAATRYNALTKRDVDIPERCVPVCKFTKAFKDVINESHKRE